MLALDLVVAEKVDDQETLEMGTKHSTEVELEVELVRFSKVPFLT